MKKKILSIIIACNIGSNFLVPVYASENPINIEFGELLTLQEDNGYTAFTGNNMLENFYQAKAELPDEVPVLDTFEVCGENVFFVDVNGDDGADGSMASPLATVSEALTRISELSQGERDRGSVIYLREGEYHIDSTLNITSQHTSDESALFISAYNDENAVLSANKSIPLTLANKVTEDNTDVITLRRINNNATGRLYYINYENMELDKIPYESVFYINDIPMYASRYPNQGADTVERVIQDGSYINSEGFVRTGLPMEWESQDKRPFTWKDTGDIHIFGRVANEWSLTDGIVWLDDKTKTVKSTSAITPNYSPITTNFWGSISSTYYYANIFEELDTFGEWFADNDAQRFYFYLPEGTDIKNTVINYKKHEGYAIDINDASNVVIDKLNIAHTDQGVNINESNNVVLQNCKINNTQSTAVNMYNTQKCGILNSDIRDIQNSYAVKISQSSDKLSELVPRRNFIQNSYIGNVSQAIDVRSTTGNIFSHNLIENTAYSAVNLSGAENIFEYNEFSSVANKITDAGGIYVGGDIKNRANTIRYNYFHDSRPDKKNARAIYNDDCSDMSWNYGNVIRNFSYGVFLHSGDDHVVMDNVVINASTYIKNSADYALQEILMKNYFFQSSPQFVTGYINNNLESSSTWQTRYKGILKEKYEQVIDAKAGYNKDSANMYQKVYNVIIRKKTAKDYANAEDVQKCVDLVADTGCYYMNNTYVVPGRSYSNGYGPSSYGLYNTTNNGGKPKVVYLANEEATKNYDVSELVSNMGLTDGNVRQTQAPEIYMESNKEFAIDEFTGVSWSRAANCSYYKAEIATDRDFENVVISYNTADNEYPVYKYVYDSENDVNIKTRTDNYEFLTDTPYFIRVTAISLAGGADRNTGVSDTVEFVLRDELQNHEKIAKTYFGKTSMKIKINGKVPRYLLNQEDKQITFIMYEGELGLQSIKNIAQINPESNGTFDYVFSADITDNTRLRIKAGDADITDELLKNGATEVAEIAFTADVTDITAGEVVTAVAKVNNMFGVTDKFKVIIAAYGENGTLIGCKTANSDEIASGEIVELSSSYTLPDSTKSAKAFIWNESDMKSLTDVIK